MDISKIPLTKARHAGDLLFLSGQIALAGGRLVNAGIEGQTRQVLENIKAVLAEYDLDLANVVNATVWLPEEADFPAFNAVYASYFSDNPPTRSTVVSDLMLGAKVEIAVIAHSG